MSYVTTEDVGVAVPRVQDGPASLLLDDVGLAGLGDALAAAVLAPLARYAFPEFPALDSRHAFSLHKRSYAEPAPFANASASRHNDVCEVSMNLCLTASGLAGSRVAFFADDGGDDVWVDHEPGAAFVNVCRDQHGVEPVVSGSRDTLVLRAFASSHRRAPAEVFRERCLPPSINW